MTTNPFEVAERDWEHRLRTWAPPVALALAFLAMKSELLRGILRTFFTMWVHELGHAVAAWLAGFGAVPGPWRTSIAEERSAAVVLLVAGGLGYAVYRLYRAERRVAAALVGALLLVQAYCTFALRRWQAEAFFTFAGDGGQFVLGTALVGTFWAPEGSKLRRDALRWGFLVIGACAFMDGLATWWAARSDGEAIPFGEIEGVGLSDPTRLVDDFGWTVKQMVSRYLLLATLGGLTMAVLYVRGLRTYARTRIG